MQKSKRNNNPLMESRALPQDIGEVSRTGILGILRDFGGLRASDRGGSGNGLDSHQFLGELKLDILFDHGELFYVTGTMALEIVHDLGHEDLRRRRAGGDAHGL